MDGVIYYRSAYRKGETMSAYQNAGSKSQENPTADYLQPVAAISQVGEEMEPVQHNEDYLLPTDQRDDYLEPKDQKDDGYEKYNVYEDLDSYTQQSPHYDEIPLSVIPPCPPRTREHSTTPDRAYGPEPGGSGGYLEILPTPPERPQPDCPARTNKNVKWFVLGLAVFAVIGVVIGITVTYTTGNTTGNGVERVCSPSPCKNGGECYQKEDTYLCQCPSGVMGKQCELGFRVAFSANSPEKSGSVSDWTDVEFKNTRVNLGDRFTDDTFTSPADSVYLVSMSGLGGSSRPLNITLEGAPQSVGLSRTSTAHDGTDGIGRTLLLDIPSNNSLKLAYRGHLTCCAVTSWTMFSVSGLMDPLVAFSVAITEPWTTPGRVTYNHLLVNMGGDFDKLLTTFVAPRSGVYFFSISAGLQAGKQANLELELNGTPILELLGSSTIHDGTDMISTAILLDISAGDKLDVTLNNGSIHSSPGYTESAFSGFLLAPAHGMLYAWSVWRTTTWRSQDTLDPVPFDNVLVDIGGMYSTEDHTVTIPVTGVYYLQLVGGTLAGHETSMFTRSNSSDKIGSIYHASSNDNGVMTTSNGYLVTLTRGERLWAVANGYTNSPNGLYSNEGRVTGFLGFLVYPT